MKDLMSHEEFIEATTVEWHLHKDTYSGYIRDAYKFIFSNKKFARLLDGENTEDVLRSIFDSEQAIDMIKQMLTKESKSRTSNSWRKLRRSAAVLAKSVGSDDFAASMVGKNAWKNPTPESQRFRQTGKSLRQKTVTDIDFNMIMANRRESEDSESCALLNIGRYLGARPTEMNRIEVLDAQGSGEITVFIGGSKKTKKGESGHWKQRGIDRTLTLKLSRTEMIELTTSILIADGMEDKDVEACRKRITRNVSKIWPQRSRKFCLYSLRYTMGSNLKKSYNGYRNKDKLIAAAMGHLSTSSASSYGNIKSGVKTGVPVPSKETLAQVEVDTGRKRSYGKQRRRQRTMPSGAPAAGMTARM
ncbi:hypothetical protein IOQ59_11010 [Pontibacterium sp. N1Y112]|uniref:Uncharacterized protein n=1 Tax=Pontibacterium sinense TaxID=2781979 RepID=A0A8J7KAA9_9GAMM|nr:hypothetical protein [Pontibacterium sinense]MBE9397786.1 hypothetical protein [Pontibacterium sinense]